MISNAKVVPAQNSYRPLPGNRALNFHRKTVLKKLSDDKSIPTYKFNCIEFQEAKTRVGNIVDLIDVAGRLTTITTPKIASNGSEKIDILLENQRAEEIKISLWEDKARYFKEQYSKYKASNINVIVCGTLAKNIGGRPILSSISATHIYFNIEHPAILSLISSDVSTESTNGMPKLVQEIQSGVSDDSFKKTTIDKLFETEADENYKDIFYSIEATIIGFIPNFGWYYLGCDSCGKKIDVTTTNKRCQHCTNETIIPKYKYKVICKVKDTTANTTVIMFDKQVQTLTGVPVQHILDTDEEATPFTIPTVINNMIGKQCLFYLKLTEKNTIHKKEEYQVMKVTHLKNKDIPLLECASNQVHAEKQISNTTMCIDLTQKIPATAPTEGKKPPTNSGETMHQRKVTNVLDMNKVKKKNILKQNCETYSKLEGDQKMKNADRANQNTRKKKPSDATNKDVTHHKDEEHNTKAKRLKTTSKMESQVQADNKTEKTAAAKPKRKTKTYNKTKTLINK